MDLSQYIAPVADFPIPGVAFKDITPLLADPEAFGASVDRLADLVEGLTVDRIAAFDARGFLWAAPLAYKLALPLVPIRKAGKLPRARLTESYQGEYGVETVELHDDAIGAGESVLLLDDVIATGGSMLAGCRLVERLGGTVAACAAVIEFAGLGAPAALENYRTLSLIKY
ncbi:adenine phosphoribosyltransferase [Phytomonospora sp. NPDC050363]|uniref:adenine phosphoribosyltransferase n=1 Tax=Phytomonospora sp. NPDC050363 TaxID=3155642 RepID=UPI00340D9DAC